MKSILFLVSVLTFGALAWATSYSDASRSPAASDRIVVLEKKNTAVLRLPFTSDTVSTLQQQLIDLSNKLPKNEPIYLYLDTPGGSISAGQELISSVKGLPVEVKTITSFSASMGYITVQSLGERLILPHGTLMSHRAFIGMEGQIPGEFNTRAKFYQDAVEEIETHVASRVGLNHTDYAKLIKDEYWVAGNKAVESKHADAVVIVKCGQDLQGSHVEKLQTFFGTVEVEWSDCPLIAAPISVNFAGLYGSGVSAEEINNIRRALFLAMTNKRNFLSDQSTREAYFRYFR